jgi:hypothetical protein
MISTSIVALSAMVDGAICAFHREAEGQRAVQADAVTERAHAQRVVADALQRQPERRA